MPRRTTIEIDEELLRRAQRALGTLTIRGTVEEALRRTAARLEAQDSDRVARQQGYLTRLPGHLDVEVLASEEMWR